jgi:hypothetical protein
VAPFEKGERFLAGEPAGVVEFHPVHFDPT